MIKKKRKYKKKIFYSIGTIFFIIIVNYLFFTYKERFYTNSNNNIKIKLITNPVEEFRELYSLDSLGMENNISIFYNNYEKNDQSEIRENIYPDYFKNLKAKFPNISNYFIKMNSNIIFYNLDIGINSTTKLEEDDINNISNIIFESENIYLKKISQYLIVINEGKAEFYCDKNNYTIVNELNFNLDYKKKCIESNYTIKKLEIISQKNNSILKLIDVKILDEKKNNLRVNHLNISIASLIFALTIIILIEIVISSKIIKFKR